MGSQQLKHGLSALEEVRACRVIQIGLPGVKGLEVVFLFSIAMM